MRKLNHSVTALALSALTIGLAVPAARGQAPEYTSSVVRIHAPNSVVPKNAQPSVTYTTTVKTVRNTKHYAPYRPTPIHDLDLSARRKQINLLKGNAEQVDVALTPSDITTYGGCDLGSDKLVRDSAESSSARTANISRQAFRSWIEKNHPGALQKSIPKGAVLILKGKWDHAEHVLSECGIPFTLADASSLHKFLPAAQIVVVNCPGLVGLDSLASIRSFVERGGYLLTTDWALDGCLQPSFPHYAKWDGAYSENEVVNSVTVDRGNSLLTATPQQAPWKLDAKSQIVTLGSEHVDVLARSKRLSLEDPAGLGILALTFSCGKGKVLHLVGHFNNNTNLAFASALPDPAPQVVVSLRQQIALNFVLERLEERD